VRHHAAQTIHSPSPRDLSAKYRRARTRLSSPFGAFRYVARTKRLCAERVIAIGKSRATLFNAGVPQTGRYILFGTITIQLQVEEDGSIAMSYILSGETNATKVRHSRLAPDTVAADVASVLSKAVPLLTPQSPRPPTPPEFYDIGQLDSDTRAQTYASLRRLASTG
jgi:hypothetical protein